MITAKYDQPRGIIQSADGVVLAQSVPTTKGSYSTSVITQWGSIRADHGYLSFNYLSTGVEATYGPYLAQHNRPIKTIRDLLTTPVETDTVTLTLSSKLQETAQQALAGRDGAIVVLDPTTGAILAMYSNPTYDPNPLAVNNATIEALAFKVDNTIDPPRAIPRRYHWRTKTPSRRGRPSRSSPPAAYEYAPTLVDTPMPYYTCIPGGTLGGQAPNRPLCNFREGWLWWHDCRDAATVVRHRVRPARDESGRRVDAGRGAVLRLQPAAPHRPAPEPLRGVGFPPRRLLEGSPNLPGVRVHRPGLHRRHAAADGPRGRRDRRWGCGDDPTRHVRDP